MTKAPFDFSMQILGGRDMLGAVRDLASHVATYAGGKAIASTVADEVVAATEAAMAASWGAGSPIDYRFTGSDESLDVFISCGHVPSLAATHLSRGLGLSVDWNVIDERQVCHIRQTLL